FEDRYSDELQPVDLHDPRRSFSQPIQKGLPPPSPTSSLPSTLNDDAPALTVRAVLVGVLLGSIISASNMYLGLTIGWTFGASLFGSIVGFAILKPLSRILPNAFGGGHFGPKENCTVQSAATAAGGLSVGFVSAIPALYRLGLMSERVTQDIVPLLLWSLAAAYYGLFFAIPLRRYFSEYLTELLFSFSDAVHYLQKTVTDHASLLLQCTVLKQKLPFPSPTIAAKTILSLHSSTTGERTGRQQFRILAIFFVISFALKIITYWVPVLLEWHVLYWIGHAAKSVELMNADVMWRWRVELAGAFVGAGMLVGGNTSASFLGGSVLAWGIIGPFMLGTHFVSRAYGFPSLSPTSTPSQTDIQSQLSAQYWLLWPGVTIMIVSSFAELGVRWRSIWRGLRGFFLEARRAVGSVVGRVKRRRAKDGEGDEFPLREKEEEDEDEGEESDEEEED
ncbi:hypothetical protein HK097_005781, partial [Rhizophlyctis rosea]